MVFAESETQVSNETAGLGALVATFMILWIGFRVGYAIGARKSSFHEVFHRCPHCHCVLEYEENDDDK